LPIEHERSIFLEALRERGQRVTSARLALLDEVFSQHGHLDAEQLLERMRVYGHKISRATIYRNLELLIECGLVRKYRLGQDRFLYEHVHPGQTHDHIACRECGQVVEFVSPAIDSLLQDLCDAHGFESDQNTVQVVGLCGICARSNAAQLATAS
jgi:Fur family ferric uptake transcriptional regulator